MFDEKLFLSDRKAYKEKCFRLAMEKKRAYNSLVVFLLLAILLVGIVSAVWYDPTTWFKKADTPGEKVAGFIDDFTETLSPIFRALLGGVDSGGDLFSRILVFFLVVLVTYGVLGTMNLFGGKRWISVAIGFVIALLGVRFLPDNLITLMALPSGALVATITLGIPFIVGFIIIERVPSSPARRALWAGYGAILIVLFFYSISSLGWQPWHWMYLLIFIAIILAFWFDGTLQKWWGRASARRTIESGTNVERDRLKAKITDLQTSLGAATTQVDRNRILKEIDNLKKNLASM